MCKARLTCCCFATEDEGPAIGLILAVGGSTLLFSESPELVDGLAPYTEHNKNYFLYDKQ